MIEELKVKHWEGHRAFTARFTGGLNLIVGCTDSGKSSLVRAIGWIARHEPLKSGTITHGEDSLRVGVKTSRGSAIRFKDSSGYGYKAGGETFLACATQQPKAVADIINLAPINISLQDDDPYLIRLSPGQLAQAINEIVDLASIDKCISWLKTQRARARTLAESASAKKKALAEQLEGLEWAKAADVAYSGLQSLAERHERLKKRNSELWDVLFVLGSTQAGMDALIPMQEALEEYTTRAAITQGSIHRTKTRKQALTSVLADLAACSGLGELEAYGSDLVALAMVRDDWMETASKTTALGQLIHEATKIIPPKIKQTGDLGRALSRIISMQEKLGSKLGTRNGLRVTINMIREAEHEANILTQTKLSIEQKMGVCPECGQPLKTTEK